VRTSEMNLSWLSATCVVVETRRRWSDTDSASARMASRRDASCAW
jgi:hypothetical protein